MLSRGSTARAKCPNRRFPIQSGNLPIPNSIRQFPYPQSNLAISQCPNSITRLPDYPITKFFRLPPPDFSLVLHFKNVRRVEIESRSGPRVRAAEFRVAAVTDGHVFEAPVDDQIDQRGSRQNAIGDDVAAEPVKDA